MSALAAVYLLPDAARLRYHVYTLVRLESRRCDIVMHGKVKCKENRKPWDDDMLSEGSECRVVAKAGLGRFSGAVHGSNSRSGRVRRPPTRPENEDGRANDDKEVQADGVSQQSYEQIDMERLSVLDDMHHYYDAEGSCEPADTGRTDLDSTRSGQTAERGSVDTIADDSSAQTAEQDSLSLVDGSSGKVADQDSVTKIVDDSSGAGSYPPVEVKEEVSSRPSEDRRRTRGREGRKLESSGPDAASIPSIASLGDVIAPVAVTILTDPEAFQSEQTKNSVEISASALQIGQAASSVNGAIAEEAHHEEDGESKIQDSSTVSSADAVAAPDGVKKHARKLKTKAASVASPVHSPSDRSFVRLLPSQAERPVVLEVLASDVCISSKRLDFRDDSPVTLDFETSSDNVLRTADCQSVPVETETSADNGVSTSKSGSESSSENVVPIADCHSVPAEMETLAENASSTSKSDPSSTMQVEREMLAENGLFKSKPDSSSTGDLDTGFEDSGETRSINRDMICNQSTLGYVSMLRVERRRPTADDGSVSGGSERSILTKENGQYISSNGSAVYSVETHSTLGCADEDLQERYPVLSVVLPPAVVEQATDNAFASKVVELPVLVAEQAVQVVGQVVEILPDPFTDQVSQIVGQVTGMQNHVVEQVSHVAGQMAQIGQQMVDQVSEVIADSVVEQVTLVAEQISQATIEHVNLVSETVSQAADQVEQVAAHVSEQVQQAAEQVSNSAAQVTMQVAAPIVELFSADEESDSDDEFDTYKTSDLPEFKGMEGLQNFTILQEETGLLSRVYDFYSYMLKKPLPEFAVGMFAAPIFLSMIFTLLYLPEYQGLALDETARDFFNSAGATAPASLEMSWRTIFQVFMFSLSLSTGLQPELAPLSPYTLVVANVNALVAQLIFVFLSGAVFARLSQPSQPVRCSTVALVCPTTAQRRRKECTTKVFMTRYVLVGPQPCELVDVKVDLTYKYNTLTRSGSYFRATQSLKLMYLGSPQVRAEIAFLNHGMLVRHVIDETSPLYQRTPEMLKKEDAVFVLSVVGLERASMQSVFHVQHYCVYDDKVVWDAEFEDMILISKKNKRIVDHSKLSLWRAV